MKLTSDLGMTSFTTLKTFKATLVLFQVPANTHALYIQEQKSDNSPQPKSTHKPPDPISGPNSTSNNVIIQSSACNWLPLIVERYRTLCEKNWRSQAPSACCSSILWNDNIIVVKLQCWESEIIGHYCDKLKIDQPSIRTKHISKKTMIWF